LIALSLLRLSRAFENILTVTGLDANALLDDKITRCKDLILIKEELTALGLDASGVVAALARIFEPPEATGSLNGAVGNYNSMLASNNAEMADVENLAPAFLNEKNSVLLSSLETAPRETQNIAAAQTLEDSQKSALPKIRIPKPAEVRLSQPSENVRKRASVILEISSSDEASCSDGGSSSDTGSSSSCKSGNATHDPLPRPRFANIPAPSQKINSSRRSSGPRRQIFSEHFLKTVYIRGSKYISNPDGLNYGLHFDEQSKTWFVQEQATFGTFHHRILASLPPTWFFKVFRTKGNGQIWFQSYSPSTDLRMELLSSELAMDFLRNVRTSSHFTTRIASG
ncbi:hypothetical protein MMC29_004057, partial [Sticta canariensis]|nr:hypothetical protein [Sticta canariensis]